MIFSLVTNFGHHLLCTCQCIKNILNVSNDVENSLNSLNLTTDVDKKFFVVPQKTRLHIKEKKINFLLPRIDYKCFGVIAVSKKKVTMG